MIDWKLLAEQKATLADIIINGLLTQKQKEHLDGLLSFVDLEQDTAADRLPLGTVLFMSEDGFRDANNQIVDASTTWKPGPKWRELVEDVINSEDSSGCDGVTVIGMDEFLALQKAVEDES